MRVDVCSELLVATANRPDGHVFNQASMKRGWVLVASDYVCFVVHTPGNFCAKIIRSPLDKFPDGGLVAMWHGAA